MDEKDKWDECDIDGVIDDEDDDDDDDDYENIVLK